MDSLTERFGGGLEDSISANGTAVKPILQELQERRISHAKKLIIKQVSSMRSAISAR
jgi:hypothetical protein